MWVGALRFYRVRLTYNDFHVYVDDEQNSPRTFPPSTLRSRYPLDCRSEMLANTVFIDRLYEPLITSDAPPSDD